jgi:DNA-directed RNA polymerase specialized sigma24 family protein
VPQECGGLFAAVVSATQGDDEPLRRWNDAAGPRLFDALIRAGFDPASADDAVLRVEEEAFLSVAADRLVESECAWEASVLRTERSRRLRDRMRRARLTTLAPESPAADASRPAERCDDIRRVRAAVAGLPSPYREAIELSALEGRSIDDVAARLRPTFGLSRSGTWAILVEARRRLRACLVATAERGSSRNPADPRRARGSFR